MRKNKKDEYDRRLTGDTGEFLVAWLLNRRGYISQRFDTESFDVVAYETANVKEKLFKVGESPFYLQVKTMEKEFKKGDNPEVRKIDRIKNRAKEMNISLKSVYFVIGFFEKDMRNVEYWIIPITEMDSLLGKSGKSYNLTREKLEERRKNTDSKITKL